ncbi:MAG: calcium/sodium antiporter [Chromatiales bacterium]|nr:calcium/sodium antiporter [Chromatiales bacterium]
MEIVLMLAGGLATLIGGAQLLVRGAGRLALGFGISPLVVGLTVVAFGTSSPELAVSVQSAWSGQVDLALGNVVGSNIFNVLLILGASALLAPLVVSLQVIRQEVPIMIAASLWLLGVTLDGGLSRGEGLLFVAGLAAYTTFLVVQSRRTMPAPETGNGPPSTGWDAKLPGQLLLVGAGLVLLVAGSNWLVEAAVSLARQFGISELVIGLTIIAAGTSLPEVATSLLATLRGERDIAVGNVVGSCIFNLLGVLGVSALAAPVSLPVAPSLAAFDMPVMIAVAIACLPVFFTGRTIARWEGGVFLGYYLAYTSYLILDAREHDLLTTYTVAMRWVVMPLTILTLAVVLNRELKARRR